MNLITKCTWFLTTMQYFSLITCFIIILNGDINKIFPSLIVGSVHAFTIESLKALIVQKTSFKSEIVVTTFIIISYLFFPALLKNFQTINTLIFVFKWFWYTRCDLDIKKIQKMALQWTNDSENFGGKIKRAAQLWNSGITLTIPMPFTIKCKIPSSNFWAVPVPSVLLIRCSISSRVAWVGRFLIWTLIALRLKSDILQNNILQNR